MLNETATERRKRIKQQDRLEAVKLTFWFLFCCLCFASLILLINLFTGVCTTGG